MPIEKEKVHPVHEVRIGRIKAVVWPVDGGRFLSTTISRIYKDGATWKESSSFGRDDLLLVAKVADMTHTWICNHSQEQNGSRDSGETNASHEPF